MLKPVLQKYQNMTLDDGFADLIASDQHNLLVWQASILIYIILNNQNHPFKVPGNIGQTRRNIMSRRFKRNVDQQYITIFSKMFDKNCTYDDFLALLKSLIKIIEEKESRDGPRAHSI